MNDLEFIKDLLDRKNNTDSISERYQLEDKVHNWSFEFLYDKIKKAEEKLGLKKYSFLVNDWNPCSDNDYGIYDCDIDEDELKIYHNYTFRGESDISVITIPLYILKNIEEGLKRYNKEKEELEQKRLRDEVLSSLRKIKNNLIKNIKDIPSDFQEIINNNFWDLI